MDSKNKLFCWLFLLGLVSIVIGANHKVNGNENYYIALLTGMSMKLMAMIALIVYNWAKLKTLFK